MKIEGKVVVVTGGANGIGEALAVCFARAGARGVVVADLDGDGAERVSSAISETGVSALAVQCDVAVEQQIIDLIEVADAHYGQIDLFCANAGIAIRGDIHANDEVWAESWQINVAAHVFAARALIPAWVARGEGYFVSTASAAGLLTDVGSAPYTVSKHAAVAFAEWLSIKHARDGVRVSCVCPRVVNTNMLRAAVDHPTARAAMASGTILEPEQVADIVLDGIQHEQFLILPHRDVLDSWRAKTSENERWMAAMRDPSD